MTTQDRNAPLLRCRDVPEHATDYMEGTLDRRTRLGMWLHLRICSMCRAYMDQMHKTRALLHRQQLPGPGTETEERLVSLAAGKPG